MSFKNNLLAFGISAAALVGGTVALGEALDYKAQHEQAIECLSPKYAGTTACRDQVVTEVTVHSIHTSENIYGWMAGVGLIGGALGMIGAYGASLDPSRRP